MLVIVDIDNCIADGRRRSIAAGPEPARHKESARYERWKNTINAGIEHDLPVPGALELVRAYVAAGHDVSYVTARGSSLREVTREWLRANNFPDLFIVMRAESDKRSSAEYKEWAIDKMRVSDHEAVAVFDDDERGELAEVCRKRGWTMFKAVYCAV